MIARQQNAVIIDLFQSVTSIVAKVFEKLVCNQLRSFMREDNIIIDEQSAFRQYHSTETTLSDSTNEWLGNMDKGLINGVLFLDLQKAFDTVNHKMLFTKLKVYRIKGCSLEWLRFYFYDRIETRSAQLMMRNKFIAESRRYRVLAPSCYFYILLICLTGCLETTNDRFFANDTTLSATGLNTFVVETKLSHNILNVD